MEVIEITSAQNPRLKEFVRLKEKSRERREAGLFLIEGYREIMRCIESRYKIRALLFDAKNHDPLQLSEIEAAINNINSTEGSSCSRTAIYCSLSHELYSRLAYREQTESFMALAEAKRESLEQIEFKKENGAPLLLVLESVEKPGNIGALLRTADACNVDAVLLCDSPTDLYNPNLIRASVGALFNLQVVTCSSSEAIRWIKRHNIKIFTAQLQDSLWYYNTDMTSGCAIVMGSEAKGVTEQWRRAADAKIKIPMLGISDSLNVSVSAAVLCYEAIRQRKEKEDILKNNLDGHPLI